MKKRKISWLDIFPESMKQLSKTTDGLIQASILAVIATYAFFSFEWLFFATKPSFLTSLSVFDGLSALFVVVAPVVLFALLIVVLAWTLSLLVRGANAKLNSKYLCYATPALIISATIFLLIENFTYTVFQFNVGSFGRLGSIFYILGLTALMFVVLEKIVRQNSEHRLKKKKWQAKIAGVLLITSVLIVSINAFKFLDKESGYEIGSDGKQPNILILSTDGLNASNSSAYGYKRPTTRFLEKFKNEALYAENSFTNCAHTGCSITSLLTGKSPLQTKVIFPPDILTGKDAYEHLPGILQRAGYKTMDISVRHYGDAYDLNIRRGFNISNGRTENTNIFSKTDFGVLQDVADNAGYFYHQSLGRLKERIYHLLGLEEMQNPYHAVTQPWRSQKWLWNGSDPHRVEELLWFINKTREKFFVHVHFMDTHGAKFRTRDPYFSKGKKQERDWMVDFYDDSIRDFDRYVHKIVGHLKKTGIYENTIIVITSDHGKNRTTHYRLPFIMRFPKGAHKGIIKNNVQRLDIAPTILDYMGAPIPGWMDGVSLLDANPDKYRPIYSAHTKKPGKFPNGLWAVKDRQAPFYSLGSLVMVVCDKWYLMSLKTGSVKIKPVQGHTQSCDSKQILNPDQAREKLLENLSNSSYRVKKGDYLSLVNVSR